MKLMLSGTEVVRIYRTLGDFDMLMDMERNKTAARVGGPIFHDMIKRKFNVRIGLRVFTLFINPKFTHLIAFIGSCTNMFDEHDEIHVRN